MNAYFELIPRNDVIQLHAGFCSFSYFAMLHIPNKVCSLRHASMRKREIGLCPRNVIHFVLSLFAENGLRRRSLSRREQEQLALAIAKFRGASQTLKPKSVLHQKQKP